MTLATDMSPLSSSQGASRRFGRTSPEGNRECRAPRPPRGFRPPVGGITNVRFGGRTHVPSGKTRAQRLGIAYETRVLDCLAAIYGTDFRPAPSILYEDRSGLRRAIPDGILRIASGLIVVEVKLSHVETAWWQLTRLYAPLLAALVRPGTEIRCVEICRSYDPVVQFPRPHEVVKSLHDTPSDAVGVLQWRI